MSYIRFTANNLSEEQVDAIVSAVDLFCETVINENDDGDCTYYETELGQSFEFALAEDLDERVVEAIIYCVAPHVSDITVEATGQ